MLSKTLKEKLSAALETIKDISISNIEELVWQPTIEHLSTLIDSLISLQMTLVDVDKYFREYPNFQTQIKNLHSCVVACRGHFNDSKCKEALKEALHRAENYRLLCAYRDGAKVFLRLKDVLNLSKEDFGHLDTFSSNVGIQFVCVV